MAELTADIFRDYFGGSWLGRVTKNGEFQREIVLNWPQAFGMNAAFGTEAGMMVPPGLAIQDDTPQIAISGWRCDRHSWHAHWYNEFGGYGELQWTSQEVVNGVTKLHGSLHECKQECDDPTDHFATCEMIDHDNFKYSTQSSRKGITEIVASRIRTAGQLQALLKKQVATVKSFEAICKKENINRSPNI